jgi:hypothetical protein
VILISLCKKIRDQRSYLSAIRYLQFAIRHSPFAIRYLQFAIRYSLLAFSFSTAAQNVLAPPPIEYSQAQPVLHPVTPNQTDMLATPPRAGNEPLFRWEGIQFRPHLLYRLSYGDGIQARPGEQSKTVINEFSPGILLNLGTHWSLDYTPTLRFYSSSRFRDNLDHEVGFHGGAVHGDWTLGLSQRYSSSSQPLVETGAQTDQENYSTAFNAGYHINSKLSLELAANQDLRFVGEHDSTSQLTDTKTWSTMDWLNYQTIPQVGVAVGVGGGYTTMSAGSDMTYEQIQARLTWVPGTKLTVTVNGGVDERQFVDSGLPSLLNPIFGLAVSYHLFDPTTFNLSASRAINPSYFFNQVTETTQISLGLNQRLLKKLSLSLNGGYRQTTYKATVSGFDISREDDYTFFTARLTTPFLKRGTAAIFYNSSENTSSGSDFTFSSTQVGAELGYRF